MSFSGANNTEGSILPTAEEDDDPLKHEKKYFAPMQQSPDELPILQTSKKYTSSKAVNDRTSTSTLDSTSPAKSDIRVITFDLDNTIWKTSATISDANDALSNHLKETFGIDKEISGKRTGQLFKQFPNRYTGVDFLEGVSTENDNGVRAQESDGCPDILQNVGQTETKGPTDTEKDEKDGDASAHNQASFGSRQGGQAKKTPVYLTLLRKDAIRSLIQQKNDALAPNTSLVDLESQVDSAFEVWMEARCQSISQNFAPFAVPTLTNLRSQLISETSQKVYIGAITDGNSNPHRVAELSGLFDFLIRAEDVGATKPDKRVFKAAVAALIVELVQDGRNVEEFFSGGSTEEGIAMDIHLKSDSTSAITNWKDVEEEAVDSFSRAVGPWWVHIGDDFSKDVVGAKEFQMRTIWARELIGGSGNSNGKKINNTKNESETEKNQRSVTDVVNKSKSDGVVHKSIGVSEFLSNSLHEEYSDAILDRFDDLSRLLMQWQEEGKVATTTNGVASLADREGDMGIDTAVFQTPTSMT